MKGVASSQRQLAIIAQGNVHESDVYERINKSLGMRVNVRTWWKPLNTGLQAIGVSKREIGGKVLLLLIAVFFLNNQWSLGTK
jgi:hypothetical protein